MKEMKMYVAKRGDCGPARVCGKPENSIKRGRGEPIPFVGDKEGAGARKRETLLLQRRVLIALGNFLRQGGRMRALMCKRGLRGASFDRPPSIQLPYKLQPSS